jgi:hypothetical protein
MFIYLSDNKTNNEISLLLNVTITCMYKKIHEILGKYRKYLVESKASNIGYGTIFSKIVQKMYDFISLSQQQSKYNNKKMLEYISKNIGDDSKKVLLDIAHYVLYIKNNNKYSQNAINWLNSIMENDKNIKIMHAENGGEYTIPYTRYKVDGYCKETNTVYEYYGCVIHAHNICRNQNDLYIFGNKSNHDIYLKTLERENFIKKNYNFVSIWECEYLKNKKLAEVL